MTKLLQYGAKPISRYEIKKITAFFRKILKLDGVQCVPIIEILELVLPQIFPDFEYEIRPNEEMRGLCGVTYPEQSRIEINEKIYEKAIKGDGHARYSIAHEIGHFILHNDVKVKLCRIHPETQLKPYEDPEWQADVFAGELLAPSDLVKDMDVDEIIRLCGVSRRAAEVQKRKGNSEEVKM